VSLISHIFDSFDAARTSVVLLFLLLTPDTIHPFTLSVSLLSLIPYILLCCRSRMVKTLGTPIIDQL